MLVNIYGESDIGCSRSKNEDVLFILKEVPFFALADGMGGHKAGDIAALETIQSLHQVIQKLFSEISPKNPFSIKEIMDYLQYGIHFANQRVWELSHSDKSFRGMGSTLCLMYLYEKELIYANVGDSRIYLLRNGTLQQLTKDHSYKNALITEGKMQPEENLPSPYRNMITKAIGIEDNVEPDIETISLEKKDFLFMCSDGLWDFVEEKDFLQIEKNELSIKEKVQMLIHLAKENGSKDNISLLMLQIEPEPAFNVSHAEKEKL
jgi:PPM family protein phosphatase